MEFLAQYGLFLLKTVTFVIATLFTVAGVFSITKKPKSHLEVIPLNPEFEKIHAHVCKEVTGKKPEKPQKKKKSKADSNLYVIDFSGDIKASQVEQLRTEVTALLTIATPKDEVLIRLESPGGAVNGYGLAASQLQRICQRNIPLTVCIDKVAASGGYLMACLADKIIAAPFAIIGSIGVVAPMPNVHRWLKKHDIDFEMITAGEYKRTLTIFGENTEKGRQKFKEDLEKIHDLFRDYVLQNRSFVDIQKVATGEHWLAKDALALRLVDELKTSDDYLHEKLLTMNGFKIKVQGKQSFTEKLLKPATKILHPWA